MENQAEIVEKFNKRYVTPWGWTFAIWKLFAFFIYVFIKLSVWLPRKKTSKWAYSRKYAKKQMCLFNETISSVTVKMKTIMKNRSHKYYTSDKDFSKDSNTKNIKTTD